MKFIYYTFLIILPGIIYAMDDDSLVYHHGLLVEFEGATIDQVDYRYQVTDVSRITIRLHFEYEKDQNDNSAINNSNYYSYSGIVGYEHDIYCIGSASLFLFLGLI